jgi:hypothetical protein
MRAVARRLEATSSRLPAPSAMRPCILRCVRAAHWCEEQRILMNNWQRGVVYFALLSCLVAAVSVQSAFAQDVFSSGDSGNSDIPDSSGGGPDQFGSTIAPGDCTGIDRIYVAGRCSSKPLPGYTNCGPYYNSYQYYVQATLKHLSGACVVRNGNQLWCHQKKAGMCNPDLGGLPDVPLVDSGTRLTQNCQSVCDRTIAKGGPSVQQVVPSPSPCTSSPVLLVSFKWPEQRHNDLQKAATDAREMLLKAQKRLADWDNPAGATTRSLSRKWFGDDSATTKIMMIKRVNGALAAMSKMTVEGNYHPGDPQWGKGAYAASGHGPIASANPQIWIFDPFWRLPANGAESKTLTVVHELSHIADDTKDNAYGQPACEVLGKNAANPFASFYSWAVMGDSQYVYNQSHSNASSFMYFIYFVSGQ